MDSTTTTQIMTTIVRHMYPTCVWVLSKSTTLVTTDWMGFSHIFLNKVFITPKDPSRTSEGPFRLLLNSVPVLSLDQTLKIPHEPHFGPTPKGMYQIWRTTMVSFPVVSKE